VSFYNNWLPECNYQVELNPARVGSSDAQIYTEHGANYVPGNLKAHQFYTAILECFDDK
jgi:hypothetical protein